MLDGHGDPPLSDLGHWQAQRVGDRLAVEPISAIYTSSLVRTKQTANPLATASGLIPQEVPALREIFLGEGEGGLLRQWVAEGHPIIQKMFSQRDWGVIPGAESAEELTARCSTALAEVAERHRDEVVAVFVHGGVIGALVGHALRTSAFAHAGSRHTGITHLVITSDRWILRSFNDAGHIGTLTADTQL